MYHRHHILPSSLGGDDSPKNLVYLTLREHYVCHWLLTRMTKGSAQTKMVCAFARFRSAAPSSLTWSRSVKSLKGTRNPFYGRRHTEKSRRKISENHGMRGRSCYDVWVEKYGVLEANIRREEMLAKRSASMSGDRNPMYGTSRTPAQRARHSELMTTNHPNKGVSRVWVYREGKTRQVLPEALDAFLENGWRRGRKP